MATTKKVTATPAPKATKPESKATPTPKVTKSVAKAAPAPVAAPKVAKAAPKVVKAAPAPVAAPKIAKAAPAPVAPVETVVKVSQEAVEKAVAMGEEQIAAATKAGADAYKSYEDVIAFSKSNMDAFVKSNEIFSKGFKEINSSIMQLAQANIEETVAVAQKLMGCTSVNEIVEIQSTVAKSQYEKAVVESRKISEQTVKLAESASKPITERVTVAVDTLSKPLAA